MSCDNRTSTTRHSLALQMLFWGPLKNTMEQGSTCFQNGETQCRTWRKSQNFRPSSIYRIYTVLSNRRERTKKIIQRVYNTYLVIHGHYFFKTGQSYFPTIWLFGFLKPSSVSILNNIRLIWEAFITPNTEINPEEW